MLSQLQLVVQHLAVNSSTQQLHVKVLSRILSAESLHTCCSWMNPEKRLPMTQLTKNSSKATGGEWSPVA